MKSPLSPPPLRKGDHLGIIAPAGQLYDRDRFHQGVKILGEMGFQVKFPRDLWPGTDYLADSDDNRAQEVNSLFRDPEVKGLIALRGGYGCLRMLDGIDLGLVRDNPKLLVGFSDITILQNYLFQQTGLSTLHGPVVTCLGMVCRESLAKFFSCLTGQMTRPVRSAKLEVLRQGKGNGLLIGGNLASLVTLLGTRYDCSWDEKIIFLEDINEPMYKLDRMLTQLHLAGKLDNIGGLILGDFSLSTLQDDISRLRYREAVWNRVLEICSGSSFPIWANFPAGHCPQNYTFPLGIQATMDGISAELRFN